MDHMYSTSYKRRRSSAATTSSEIVQTMDEDEVSLFLTIHRAEGLDTPIMYPSVSERIYRVVYWVEPNKQYFTPPVGGLLDPVWNERVCIELGKLGEYGGFLNVEVIRFYSKSDPGTSSGVVVVGRAQIPLPLQLDQNKFLWYGLVRPNGPVPKGEGNIAVSMELKKIKRMPCY